MSDGMAFLTGAAFAGVAVLFMIKGGPNIGAANIPSPQSLPFSQTNPYMMPTPLPTAALASPGLPAYGTDQQRVDADRLKIMLDQQRNETEQLKAQLQNQQMIIEKLTVRNDPNNLNSPNNPNSSLFARTNQPVQAVAAQQQQDNPLLSGLVWALGGMAITVSGGVVVVGALSVLSRQQRSGRTTYVVQPPNYTALPATLQRRRTEVMPPQLDERRVDYVEYDR
ncbi:MAG: hypothetical protein ABI417_11640 [Coleofasciculaceae cyanobacterium]|jgi:hypothetical protein